MTELNTESCSPGPEDFESASTAPMLAALQKIWPTAVVTAGFDLLLVKGSIPENERFGPCLESA